MKKLIGVRIIREYVILGLVTYLKAEKDVRYSYIMKNIWKKCIRVKKNFPAHYDFLYNAIELLTLFFKQKNQLLNVFLF